MTNGNSNEELAVGMLFRSREAFRQHMAVYAISRKFRFRCAKSEPRLMSLECCSPSCPWRVYAVRLKDAEVFEIRKVVPEHLCSIDERGGYETQATAAVIGELMKNKFGAPGSVLEIAEKEYEVREKEGGGFHVNLANMTCTCFEFQMLAMPCSHPIAAALKGKIAVKSLVAEVYGVTQLRAA
ncbi:hypothetical protein Bca4012_076458 [Brassica carinata]